MRIGLIDVDSNIANPALMKLSTHHRRKGDKVEWWLGPLFNHKYDRCYASKVFDFTPEPIGMPECTQKGGIAYDIKSVLPSDIESLPPDYSIYPDCDYSVGFITRGCVRSCKFCKVPEKEGGIRFDRWWEEFENRDKGAWWMFIDNNILGWKGALGVMEIIAMNKMVVDFNQGLDARLLTPEMASVLVKVKWYKFIRFAMDSWGVRDRVMKGLEMLISKGLHPNKFIIYVLVGFGSTQKEDMDRVMMLKGIGVNPYVMCYDRNDEYQKNFSSWCNVKAVFKSVKWEEFKKSDKLKKKVGGFGRQEEFDLLYK